VSCAGEDRQHLAERGVDLEVGKRIATRHASVDDRHRNLRLPSPIHEPQPGHHRQRGPEDEQAGRTLHELEAALHSRPRHAFAEEHDVGFEQIGPTALTTDEPEPRDMLLGELDVSVRIARGDLVPAEVRVGVTQPCIQRRPGAPRPTLHTYDAVERPMQLDDLTCAGGLMQPVDILRDDPAQHTGPLKRGDREMPRVGSRGGDPPPADMRAGPVPLPRARRPAKLGDRHRQPSA
jgi:hypothetical protein